MNLNRENSINKEEGQNSKNFHSDDERENFLQPKPKDEDEETQARRRNKKLKIDKILKNEQNSEISIEDLRNLSVSEGGLLNDEIRKKIWPKLVNINLVEAQVLPSQEECEAHPEYNQVCILRQGYDP